jgi:hypothetical protein
MRVNAGARAASRSLYEKPMTRDGGGDERMISRAITEPVDKDGLNATLEDASLGATGGLQLRVED